MFNEKNITLQELGLKINVSKQAVGHWETGFRTPPIDKVCFLVNYFDVSTDYLLGLSDDPTRR